MTNLGSGVPKLAVIDFPHHKAVEGSEGRHGALTEQSDGNTVAAPLLGGQATTKA